MPWRAGGTPVTIDTLFGFVNVGIAASAVRRKPRSTSDARNGATPASIASRTYSNDEPSRHTTTSPSRGHR